MNKKSPLSRMEYETWLLSAQGSFVLHCQQALIQHMLAAWPRRGRSLLHCYCGAGLFLRQFWQHGFEVTGYEPDAALRAMACAHAPHSSDIEGGSLEHLPFDDDSVDFSVLSLPVAGDTHAVLDELWRVSRSGILLLGWNRCSLAGLGWHVPSATGKLHLPAGARWRQAWCTLKRLQPQSRVAYASTLLLPSSTWHEGFFAHINRAISPVPCGAFAALRCDFGARPASPSLPLSLLQRLSQPRISPVLESQQAKSTTLVAHSTACAQAQEQQIQPQPAQPRPVQQHTK